jgi:phospholipid/cholesterol/gamma-HCH transport system substrate-binding protein
METRASYFLVGVFVLALVTSLFGFVVWLSRYQAAEESTYYYVYFDGAVTGLSVGSTVRYRGVPVGTVSNIEIDSAKVELIEVTLALKRGTPIKTDTVASLQLQGITGLSFVQLAGGTRGAPPLEPPPGKRRATIPSRRSAIEQVFENAPELLAQLGAVAVRAAEVLSPENQKQISAILRNVAVFSDTLAQSSGSIEGIVDDTAATLRDLRQTAGSLNQLAMQLSGLSNELGADAKNFFADTAKLSRDANATVAEVQKTAKSFGRLADDLDKIVAGSSTPIRDFTSSGLYELSQFVSEARTLVASLTRLAYQLERDPARFLFGDQQKGFEAGKR